MENALRKATWKDRVLYILGRRLAFAVDGRSMVPALNDGDAVLIDPRADFHTGDIVLANHPFKQSVKVLKRVGEIDATGGVYLIGDNADESTDSRTLGIFPRKDILGKAVCRLK